MSFIQSSIFGIPLMLMSYIGALKSWVYFPVFHFFGVSPFTIRFPAIILSASTLYIYYHVARTFTNRELGLLATILMATSPAFIFEVKVDFGPVAISMFCTALILYAFAKYLE